MITNPRFNSSPQYSVKQIANLEVASNAASVTPNDSADLSNPGQLYIGGTGNVNVDTINGQTIVFSGVPVGTILPVVVKRVRSTSTTATNILVLY